MIAAAQALSAVARVAAAQQERGQPVAIAVCDDHGELLAFVRMDGASLQAGVLAQNKAYTAARDRQPTADLGAWSRSSGRTLNYWTDPRITGFGGGVPVRADGTVAGAVGVSGLSEDDDAAVAQRVIDLLGSQEAV
ncbi:MAG TPA: heme-binding protein [Telluria sp.]|nr:heme-binding protein [Telluria sp.]